MSENGSSMGRLTGAALIATPAERAGGGTGGTIADAKDPVGGPWRKAPYSRPITARMMMMSTMRPRIPDGP